MRTVIIEVKQLISIMINKQGHALKNWVEGLSDEAFYPWESPKEIPIGTPNQLFSIAAKRWR